MGKFSRTAGLKLRPPAALWAKTFDFWVPGVGPHQGKLICLADIAILSAVPDPDCRPQIGFADAALPPQGAAILQLPTPKLAK